MKSPTQGMRRVDPAAIDRLPPGPREAWAAFLARPRAVPAGMWGAPGHLLMTACDDRGRSVMAEWRNDGTSRAAVWTPTIQWLSDPREALS